MSEDKNDSELSNYLSGKMTQTEAHAFEKRALDDPFLQDAIDGAEQVGVEIFSADVKGLAGEILIKRNKPIFAIWKVAAVVTLLIVGGFSIRYVLEDIQTPQLAQESKKDISPENDDTTKIKLNVAKVDTLEEMEEEIMEEKPVAALTSFPKNERSSNASGGAGTEVKQEKFFAVVEMDKAEVELNTISSNESTDLDFEEDEIEVTEDLVSQELVAEAPPEITEEREAQNVSKAKKISANDQKSFMRSRKIEAKTQVPIQNEPNQITGTITDETGEGLPGVNVVIKGTTDGVTSDLDGAFEIAATEEDELVFSSVGMLAQQIEVGSRSVLDIEMSPDSQSLQEVVVTGYAANDNEPKGYDGARPVSGWEAFEEYLDENLFYPEEAIGKGIEGRVVLQLTISRIGTITEIVIKKSLGNGCDEEAIRLVNEGPAWRSASRDGISVEAKLRVRVKFELGK